jgi:hypothetical protein
VGVVGVSKAFVLTTRAKQLPKIYAPARTRPRTVCSAEQGRRRDTGRNARAAARWESLGLTDVHQ